VTAEAEPFRREARGDSHETVVALIGRPNAGKSSLFNRLTRGDAKVGNFPGITVDILTSEVPAEGERPALTVVDLPGLYALAAEGDGETDEGVARRWIAGRATTRDATVLVQVLDGTQLALGLRLTRELRAEPLPLMVVVTQMDLVARDGARLDTAALSRSLGVPVVAVSARDVTARDVVLNAALAALRGNALPARHEPIDPDAVALAVTSRETRSAGTLRARTDRWDRALLHPALGPVVFLTLMTAIFAAVFLVAEPVSSLLDGAARWLAVRVQNLLGRNGFSSFVVDGLIGGAGTVLTFLPQIVILTVAMELLDGTGYLARGVFLVDRLLRVAGLGGKAFVPMLTAHACAVPAIAATRILRDPKERLTAILVLPLMTCSARIPTYGLLITTFLSGFSAVGKSLVFVALYGAGVAAGMIASALLRRTVTRGRALPLAIEMPVYRAPEARAVGRAGWNAAVRFLKDVGTTIVAASALLWVLLQVPMPGSDAGAGAAPMERSVAASVGRAMEPVTRLAGFDWRINVGLIGSFGARELMVGTLGVIHGLEDVGDDTATLSQHLRAARGRDGRLAYGVPTALALMAFFVLACQCMSTVAAIRRETKSWRWALFTLGYTYAAGGIVAALVFQVARALGL
jgi:ferrous iron transport protein B